MKLIRIFLIVVLCSLTAIAKSDNQLLQQQLYRMAELSVPERLQDTFYNKIHKLSLDPTIDSHALALANILMADHYLLKDDFNRAQEFLNIAKPLVKQLNIETLQYQYDFVSILIQRGNGEINLASQMAEQLFTKVKEQWPTHKLSELVLERAYLFYFQYKYNDSLELLEQSLDYAFESNDPHQLAETYNMFGILYSELNDNDSAIEYYEKSIKILNEHPELTNPSYQFVNLADAYRVGKQFDKAKQLLDQAEQRSIKDNSLGLSAFTHQMRSRLLYDEGQYESALNSLNLAKNQADQLGEQLFLFEIHLDLAKIYLKLEQLDKAKANLQIALDQSARLGEDEIFYIEQVKAEIYATENNYQQAYQSTKLAFDHYREKFNNNLTHVSNIAREQLDRERLTFENKLLERENTLNAQHVIENKRYFTYLWISIGLLLLAILVAIWNMLRLKKLAASNQQLALTDNLTKLPNRRYVFRKLNEQHKESELGAEVYSLILFDLDHFKNINDRFGHGVGDAVIQTTNEICKNVLRDSDTIGRIGGEEFLIILPDTNKDDAFKIAERIRKSFEQYDFASIAQGLQVTSSFGVTEYLAEDECLDNVINRADRLLYKAKNEGRNRVAATFI